ncbi:single-stranded DNA-binding protein, partial [Streptococcus cuniculi]
LANWAKKGALIGVTGRIQTRHYENQQGKRVYVTEVIADSFQLLESRAKENQAANQASMAQHAPYFGPTTPMDVSDDDLPF